MTLEEAKVKFMTDVEDGAHCPCCGKRAYLYKRKLNSGMAKMLAAVANARPDVEGWVHITRFDHTDGQKLGTNGDYTYLKHWGLMEQRPKRSGESHAGHWRVTDLGKKFIAGEVMVPKKVFLVNDRLIGASEDLTDFKSALGDDFKYSELQEVSNA